MSSPESNNEITTLVVRSAHQLATRSSLVLRGLRDITRGFSDDAVKSIPDLAMELYLQDKFAEAIAICNNALEANPKDESLWQIKGVCLVRQGKNDEGFKCLTEALAIDDQNQYCWVLAAKVLRRDSYRTEEELDCWRHVIKISPDFMGAWREIGNCLVHLGRCREAVEAFDRELTLNPSDKDCVQQRTAVLEELARD
jgi:tetratricopeptide (TPR) repeat protein